MAESIYSDLLRVFDLAQDYKDFARWWEEMGQACPPIGSLPANGFVLGEGKNFIGFITNTDIDFMIMTWWLPNPSNTARQTRFYVERYVQLAAEVCKKNNKRFLFCFTDKSGMIRLLESLGFNKMGEGHFAIKVQ